MKTSILRVSISLLVLGLGLGPVSAQADILVNWIGPTGMGGNGNWNTAVDWSGGVVPNNGNGNNYSVTLPNYLSGLYTVTLDISPTIDNLTLESDATLFFVAQTALNVNANVTNRGSLVINQGSSARILGDLSTFGPGIPQVGLFVGGSLSVGGTLSVNGVTNNSVLLAQNSQLSATHYVQTGDQAQSIFFNSLMNFPDATVSRGQFSLNRSTMNGNLAVEGGFLDCGLSGLSILNGNLTMGSNAAFSDEFFSDGNVTTWSQLAISGDAILAGTMFLQFLGPEESFRDGDTFRLMTYSAETGEFSTIDWTGLQPLQSVSLVYGETELDAVVHGNPPVPEPTSLLLLGTGLLGLAYRGHRRIILR